MKLRKIVCPFLCIVLYSGCTGNEINENKNPKQEIGKPQHEIYYKEQRLESILYPQTAIRAVDEKIKSTVDTYHKQFVKKTASYKEKKKPEFNVSYQSYVKNKRYISVKLDIFERIYQNQEYIETIVYDINKKKFIHLYDIIDKTCIQKLSSKVISYFKERFPQECDNDRFRSHTSAIEDNYNCFVLKKDRIIFYFPQGTLFDNEASYEVGYQDLKEIGSKLSNEDVPTYVPYEDILNEPVKHLNKDKPMIALTFDDGPSKRYTAAILDTLKEYNACATFFVLGSNAHNAPKLLQRMVLEGSEIGNHTFTHKQLTTLSKENVEEEISAAQESIYEITHKYPNIIRPPYGSKNAMVMECAQGRKIVTWSLDSRDWANRNAKVVVERVIQNIHDGDIILMHDLYASTAQAANILVPRLQDMGYQFVTVSDLYQNRKYVK